MSTPITFNGSSYTIPAIADASWGTNVSNYLIAIASGALQKTGGSFTLSAADVDFGGTYGLKSVYFKSKTANIAAAGVVQLAKTDVMSWRNNANGADLPLGIDGSDNLTFNSLVLINASGSQTLTNKLFSDSTVKFANVSDATKLLMFSLGGATTGKTMTIVSSHTNNRSMTLPDTTDTFMALSLAQSPTNKTFDNTNSLTVKVLNFTLQDGSDVTKQIQFNAASITTGNTRTLTVPDASGTLMLLALAQSPTNKTFDNSNVFTAKVLNFTLQDGSDTTKQVQFNAASITTGTTRTLTVPDASGTIMLLALAQSPTNKTFDNTNQITLKDNKFTLQATGDVTKQVVFLLSGLTTGHTTTLSVPEVNGTDTLQLLALAQSPTNKTFDNTNILTIKVLNFTLQDGSDTTKQARFIASGITTGTIRSFTFPDASDTLAVIATQQTFTNKIFSDSTVKFGNVSDTTKALIFSLGGATTAKTMTLLSSHTNDRTITFPDATDTLMGKATTDTMTNKTATAFGISSGSYINFLVQAAARFNDSSTNYVALKAPSSVTTYTVTWPAAVPSANQVLADSGSGDGVMTWASALTTALSQYAVSIGNASNLATSTNTSLLGDVKAQTNSQTATVTIASPGVFTSNGHGMNNGDKFYLTTSSALPTGLSASTTYYASNVATNTFNASTTFANAIAGTYINTSGSQSGTHTLFTGGLKMNLTRVPTNQKFTSGSGTYTTPTNPSPLYIRLRMVGGGGGGAGGGAGASGGSTGVASTFGGSTAAAGVGGASASGGTAGAGGTATLGTGHIGINATGGGGGGTPYDAAGLAAVYFSGGTGGNSALGGGGYSQSGGVGQSGAINTGGGGAGGGTQPTSVGAGTGGGAGGYIDAIIAAPAATYSYTVGTGGNGTAGGTNGFTGGDGGSGLIIVTEFYQ